MNVLITGATGFVGSHICAKLCYGDDRILCIVRSSSDISAIDGLPNVTILRFAKEKDIYDILSEWHVDVLIHCAGAFFQQHDRNSIFELLDSNVQFPSVVIDAAVRQGCKKIINTTSYWEAYKGQKGHPVNLYASTRLALEEILRFYNLTHKCDITTLVIYGCYGYGDHRKKIMNVLRDMNNGETIDMSEGKQLISLVYIDDIVNAYVLCLNKQYQYGIFEKYDLIAGDLVSLRQCVETFLKISQKRIQINWGARPIGIDADFDAISVNGRLPDWRPLIGIEEGMRLFWGEKRGA